MANKIGTKIIMIRHKNNAIGTTTVAVSPPLPYPAVIETLQISTNAVGGDSSAAFIDLYLSNDRSSGTNPITGAKLTDHVLAGASPPDLVADAAEALPPFHAAAEVYSQPLPVWIPVPGQDYALKSVVHQLTAAATVTTVLAILILYDAPPTSTLATVVPRGTPTDPVCVQICGQAPPIEQPPIAPPPTAPPPPAPSGPDVLAAPLPVACAVSVASPLSSASALCESTGT